MVNHLRPRALLIFLLLLAGLAMPVSGVKAEERTDTYVLLGWNDLGMHCSNKNFADLAVLPPFNTFWATLIRRGTETTLPEVVGPGFTVTYTFTDNTYSVGKTDFWSWDLALFGVDLPPNVGLTGKGMTGSLDWSVDHFAAVGTPLTPYTDLDLVHEQPFQLANLTARNAQNQVIESTQIVAPVSNEMMCSGCHIPQSGETVEHAILRLHDNENGTNLVSLRPVLCANCHASNALGLPGLPNLPSLSLAMHGQHAEVTNNCYRCHPGPNTQCLRDVMNTQYGMVCQSCHGGMAQVAQSIEQGRQPWLQEPRCGTCHGANYSEAPNTLYRNSHNGHGGLYCPTCHSSPHAIVPSREERDNRQNVALQGSAGVLRNCSACHGTSPSAPGPHGYVPSAVEEQIAQRVPMLLASPNPLRERTEIRYRVLDERPIRLAVHDVTGREVRLLTGQAQTPGDHTLVWDGRDADGRDVPSGVYFCRLETAGTTSNAQLIRMR